MARYCGNCGTEVDDTAVFCPTCGQPIDEAASSEIPAAPAWPDVTGREAAPTDQPDRPANLDGDPVVDPTPPERSEHGVEPEPEAETLREFGRRDFGAAPAGQRDEAPTRVEHRPPPTSDPDDARAPAAAAAPTPDRRPADVTPARPQSSSPQIDLPFSMPVTLSGWLIGGGTLLAALGVVIILIVTALNAIDLLLLVALLGVAATVFLSARMPAIPNLRLISLVVALITFGVALDRVGFRGGGAGELLLFMGAAAAAIGAVILELGQDQPLGGPQR